jgi:hypothetical protein
MRARATVSVNSTVVGTTTGRLAAWIVVLREAMLVPRPPTERAGPACGRCSGAGRRCERVAASGPPPPPVLAGREPERCMD